ncbi:MAG: M56 family metallopeptidase [Luteolibacter sp.]|uniref:M56 family metallopeptidase n=1 Tax=Luteolibacter sp. TaxID=1962973 RepID=UPI00326398E1
MIAILLFSAIAALLVFLAGRGDHARDPRLTVLALILLVVFPFSVFLPKAAVLPVPAMEQASSAFPWLNVILGFWMMGFVVATIRLGLAARGISIWRKQSTKVAEIGGVEIRQLDGLKSPVAAGVIRPGIFVPVDWENWSDEARQMVLEHELAHHRRRDPLWRWIAEIACAVHAYNPLVLWISRRLTMQCEYACDAMVLKNGALPADYARLLCEFAEESAPVGPALAMAVASSLESRVRRLMKPREKAGNAALVVLIALTLAFAGTLATFGPALGGDEPVSAAEVEQRWSADPFPGER